MIGWADIGGMLPAVHQPTVGRETVARRIMTFFAAASGTTLTAVDVNGEPGIVALRAGAVAAVLALTLKDGLVTRVYVVADQRKLAQVRRALDRE